MKNEAMAECCRTLQAPLPGDEEQRLLGAAIAEASGLIVHGPFKRLAFCAHVLALHVDGLVAIAYQHTQDVTPLVKHMERCAIPVRVIEEEMEDERRKEIAAAVAAGNVKILYVPFGRFLKSRFRDFLLNNGLAMAAVLCSDAEFSCDSKTWQAIEAQFSSAATAPKRYWCAIPAEGKEADQLARELGLPLISTVEKAPAVEEPVDPFIQRMESGVPIAQLVDELGLSVEEAHARILDFIERSGSTNPLKWVSTASYLTVSKAAAEGATTDHRVISRIVADTIPEAELVLIVACLKNRDRLRPGQGA